MIPFILWLARKCRPRRTPPTAYHNCLALHIATATRMAWKPSR